MIRVELPLHLQTLAGVEGELSFEIAAPVTTSGILDTLEANYPMLRGTVREHATGKRRARVRFFADGEDVSHDSPDEPLSDAIASGRVAFMIVGAIAGG